MTTTARIAEADRASEAFLIALNAIGAQTTIEAMALWESLPEDSSNAMIARWLRRAIGLVLTRRRQSRDLGLAYYRLVRALRTGRTVADPRKRDEPTYVTLDMLRREFATLTKGAEGDGEARSGDSGTTTPGEAEGSPAVRTGGAASVPDADLSDRILVEEIERLRELEEEEERKALEELNRALIALGPQSRAKKNAAIPPDTPVEEADAIRKEARDVAGARQAATAGREAMNGARGEIWNATSRDQRALGYIRLSRTGTPCGWCAMLISRGPVYKSQSGAGPTRAQLDQGEYSDGDLYHDNCKCYAEPVFTRTQYELSGLYALNREYQELWPKVTRGLSGKAALSAWRRFIREQAKADRRDQESRSTTDVQEAQPA